LPQRGPADRAADGCRGAHSHRGAADGRRAAHRRMVPHRGAHPSPRRRAHAGAAPGGQRGRAGPPAARMGDARDDQWRARRARHRVRAGAVGLRGREDALRARERRRDRAGGPASSPWPWPRTGCSVTRSSARAGSARRWSSGTSGNGSPHARRRSWRSSKRCAAPSRRPRRSPGRGRMPDEIKTLSSQLAQDPDSLVFLRLGELLRHKGQLDTAHRVALTGLERHPHLPDAHDLYARILADKHDYERAFDEWDMALRIAPDHVGALKGLAFLYFKIGDVQQAAAHLEAAQRVAPDDPGVAQALAMARGGGPADAEALTAPEPIAPAAPPLEEARVLAGLEGAQEGLLLLDASGRVLGGALKDSGGRDVTDAVAAYLAGVSQEAARTVKLLGLGKWTGLAAEGNHGHVHLAAPTSDALLLVVRDRAVPMGRLAVIAQRAALAARRWLEAHA